MLLLTPILSIPSIASIPQPLDKYFCLYPEKMRIFAPTKNNEMVQIKNIHGEVIYTLPEGQELYNAVLIGLDLREADFRGADLMFADLEWADLSGADLTDADLSSASTEGLILEGAILDNTQLPMEHHHIHCC